MKLTIEQKSEIANSDEVAALYKTLAAAQSVAANRIQEFIADESSVEKVLERIKTLVDNFNSQYQSVLDSKTCPAGQHWDAVIGECVPD